MQPQQFDENVKAFVGYLDYYCKRQHYDPKKIKQLNVIYQDHAYSYEILVCAECDTLMAYVLDRLQECPHETKPRCRKCPNPCYEKDRWKQVAKVMRYSAPRVKLSEILNFSKYFR